VSPEGGHWAKDATGWWYVCANETGYLAGGWFTIDGADYQFGPSGYMMTGFLKRPSGEWVYADATGALASGWVRDGVYGGPYWYYLDPATNVMRTGWLFDRGSWYYLGSSGNMHTGWIEVGGSWYYLDLTGAMRTGWLKQGDAWYYLGPDGAMLTDVQIINGRTYVFGPSGALIG
jgi:putative PA domain protein